MKAKEQNINQWDFQDVFMSILCIIAIMVLYFGVSQLFSFDSNRVFYLIATQIIFYVAVVFTVVYLAIFKKSNSMNAFFGAKSLTRAIREGFLIFILMILITTFIDHFFQRFANIRVSDVYENFDKKLLFTISFIGVFFAPLAEEMFFRGFLQPVFVRKFGVNLGVVLVALIFSFLHFLYIDNISALFSIISVGLVLSFAKEYTGSIYPCIIAHFLNNLTAVIYMNWT